MNMEMSRKFRVKASPKIDVFYEGKDPYKDEPDETIHLPERELEVDEKFFNKGE